MNCGNDTTVTGNTSVTVLSFPQFINKLALQVTSKFGFKNWQKKLIF